MRPDLFVLAAVAVGAGLAACSTASGGARLAPRPEAPASPPPPAVMRPLRPSALGDDLRGIGLDPTNLPRFEALTPTQRRRVMSTFTRSLGVACTECHDRNDYKVSTRSKALTVTMWNGFTRSMAIVGGGALYCDSCHQGQVRYLRRDDHEIIAEYMSNELVDKLERVEARKTSLECETCHGDPAAPRFLDRWLAAPPDWFRK